jgi:death on curing protein
MRDSLENEAGHYGDAVVSEDERPLTAVDTLEYLTLQDIIWINLEVTGEANEFSAERLEEAVFHQYAYRRGADLFFRAGDFLEALLRLRPFDDGNRRTAFLSTVAFLAVNGYALEVTDQQAYSWLKSIIDRQVSGHVAISKAARPSNHTPRAVRPLIHGLIGRYEHALEALGSETAEAKAA